MIAFDAMEWAMGLSDKLRKGMAINRKSVAVAEDAVRRACAKLDAVLADHAYLAAGQGGDSFGGADLAWSALVGWLVQVPEYTAGNVVMPQAEEWPAEFAALSQELRATRAGQHVVTCYAKHRL